MVIKKDFYDFPSFCEALSVDNESVRQALARGEIDAYLHPREVLAQLRFYSATNGVAPESGRSQHATWRFTTHPYKASQNFYYLLTGWFQVDPESLQDAALKGGWRAQGGYSYTPCRVVFPKEHDGLLHEGDVCEFVQEEEKDYEGATWVEDEPTYTPSLLDLWFSANTVERLKLEGVRAVTTTPMAAEKVVSTRERNNLVRIIYALAKHADIDISERSDGAAKIEALLVGAGFDGPKVKTIREVLAAARNLD